MNSNKHEHIDDSAVREADDVPNMYFTIAVSSFRQRLEDVILADGGLSK